MTGEGGAVALAATWWCTVLLALAMVVVAAGIDVAVAGARARSAADAAALAGAGAHPVAGGPGDACGAADRLADAGGARLAACTTVGHAAERFRVEVRVVVEPVTAAGAVAGTIGASAVAGLVPAGSADQEP